MACCLQKHLLKYVLDLSQHSGRSSTAKKWDFSWTSVKDKTQLNFSQVLIRIGLRLPNSFIPVPQLFTSATYQLSHKHACLLHLLDFALPSLLQRCVSSLEPRKAFRSLSATPRKSTYLHTQHPTPRCSLFLSWAIPSWRGNLGSVKGDETSGGEPAQWEGREEREGGEMGWASWVGKSRCGSCGWCGSVRGRSYAFLARLCREREGEMPMGELMTARALAVRLNLAFALAVGTLPSWLRRRRACTTAHP